MANICQAVQFKKKPQNLPNCFQELLHQLLKAVFNKSYENNPYSVDSKKNQRKSTFRYTDN